MLIRLAIISTHPIQYNAPLFKLLSERGKIEIKVYYTWGRKVMEKKYDPGFGKNVQWDIPILEGYNYEFVENVSKDPASHHFKGINNPGLVHLMKEWNPNALLVYGWSFKSHLKLIRHFKGRIPVFFRGDSTLLQKQTGLKVLLRKLFLNWVYSHIDKALYVGTNNKAYYKQFGLKEEQLIFAPHAIDNKAFYVQAIAARESVMQRRISLGIGNDEIVFLYAGKLDRNKNTHLLAEAFTKIEKPNCHLILVGNGEMENSLKEMYQNHPSIHFIPFQNQSQMPMIYSLCDVFVLPSISETWGLGINEAMACGKAVLVSDSCGAAIDLIEKGKNGFTFQSNNLDDLIEKMNKLLNGTSNLKEMGKESLKIIDDWSYENDCLAIETLLI